jgi:hypothetical protein
MSNKARTTRFFWMATLQAPIGPGAMKANTMRGTVMWEGPASREALFNWFWETYAVPNGFGSANVMYWSCEPDTYDMAPGTVVRAEYTDVS